MLTPGQTHNNWRATRDVKKAKGARVVQLLMQCLNVKLSKEPPKRNSTSRPHGTGCRDNNQPSPSHDVCQTRKVLLQVPKGHSLNICQHQRRNKKSLKTRNNNLKCGTVNLCDRS